MTYSIQRYEKYIDQIIERMFTMVQQQLPTGFRDDIGAVAERKDDVSQIGRAHV